MEDQSSNCKDGNQHIVMSDMGQFMFYDILVSAFLYIEILWQKDHVLEDSGARSPPAELVDMAQLCDLVNYVFHPIRIYELLGWWAVFFLKREKRIEIIQVTTSPATV